MGFLCCIFSSIMAVFVVTALPEYHQYDYDVKFERGAILWYNHEFITNVTLTFPFYNRTTRMYSISGYLLNDMTSSDLVADMQMSKFLSNEYRYFPLSIGANMCVEYANNNANSREILKNISNLSFCPLKKGFYYIRNFVPDYSKLPPFIPRGRYKSLGRLLYNQKLVGEAETYWEIKDKPLKYSK